MSLNLELERKRVEMIKNHNDLTNYSNYNKIYIPSDYINSNYQYRISNDYILIVTNNNCYSQYSSTYCDCYYYDKDNNLISNSYTCNQNSSSSILIPFNSITNDINYSNYLTNRFYLDKSLVIIMFILAFVFAKLLLGERRHI